MTICLSKFAVWRWPKWMWGILVAIVPGFYVLSEAPLKRLELEMQKPFPRSPYAPCCGFKIYDAGVYAGPKIFRPVHMLFDHTPLQKPLIAWAKLWGVDSDLLLDSLIRTGLLGLRSPRPGVLTN